MKGEPAPSAKRPFAAGGDARRRRRWLWAISAVVAVLAAIAVVRLAFASPQEKAEAKTAAPKYSLTDVAGHRIAFPDGKPTLLYFMAAWCSSCWQGESTLVPLWRAMHGRAEFVSLDVTPQLDSPSSIALMAEKTRAGWPQAYATAAILNRFHVTALDTVVVLSPSGRVLYNGPTPGDQELARLLGTGKRLAPRPASNKEKGLDAQGVRR